ncbi:MAG: helix-turn-helix domain-containing protein [Pseudonocardia sp.]
MSDGSDGTIGSRLVRLRGTHMTQIGLAAAAGVSVDLIHKLEQGVRHSVSIPSLQRLARALDVEVSALLTDPPKRLESPSEHAGVIATRRVLTSVDDLFPSDVPETDVGVGEVQRAVTHAWGAYWAGRYQHLTKLLPQEITRARSLVAHAPTDDRGVARHAAAQLLQLAACTMTHCDHADAAHIAVRESMQYALAGPDPLLPAALHTTMAWVLLNQGRYDESRRVAMAAASTIQPGGSSPLPQWTLYGSALITAATANARYGDRAEATSLLAEARVAATRTGARNDYEAAFGPDQVLMQTVDVDVVTEHYGAALTVARRMPRDTVLPVAARARHLSDIAVSQIRTDADDHALATLLAMERLAPDWMRFQAHPRQIVAELRERSVAPELRELAERVGLTG